MLKPAVAFLFATGLAIAPGAAKAFEGNISQQGFATLRGAIKCLNADKFSRVAKATGFIPIWIGMTMLVDENHWLPVAIPYTVEKGGKEGDLPPPPTASLMLLENPNSRDWVEVEYYRPFNTGWRSYIIPTRHHACIIAKGNQASLSGTFDPPTKNILPKIFWRYVDDHNPDHISADFCQTVGEYANNGFMLHIENILVKEERHPTEGLASDIAMGSAVLFNFARREADIGPNDSWHIKWTGMGDNGVPLQLLESSDSRIWRELEWLNPTSEIVNLRICQIRVATGQMITRNIPPDFINEPPYVSIPKILSNPLTR